MNVKDAYLTEYERILNSISDQGVTGAKRAAMEGALESFPEAGVSLSARHRAVADGRTLDTPEELLGAEIMNGMSNIVQKWRKRADGGTRRRASITGEHKKVGTRDMYKEWADKNDYVPSDAALSHFSGFSRALFGNYRAALKMDGYEFASGHHNGWDVKARPVRLSSNDNGHAAMAGLSPDQIGILIKLAEAFK